MELADDEHKMLDTVSSENCGRSDVHHASITDDVEPLSQQEQKKAKAIKESHKSKLDPKVRMDLKFILEENLDEIITKYACYVDCIRVNIKAKEVTPEDLRSFLLSVSAFCESYEGESLSLMSERKSELMKMNTITDIFIFLTTECTSFLNYNIFQKLIENYKITINEERLKYHEHLKAYIEKHKISEFAKINPLLKSKSGFQELILKYDIKHTCKLAKIFELKIFLAKILKLNPSTIHIVDIDDGCVIVTFLIPAIVAAALFASDKIFTSKQEEELRTNSVLWIKCNSYTYNFEKQQLKKNTKPFDNATLQVNSQHLDADWSEPAAIACHSKEDVTVKAASLFEKDTLFCRVHSGREISFFCETCGEAICWKCVDKCGRHHNHYFNDLKKTFDSYQAKIHSLLSAIEKALAQLDTFYDDISNQQAAIEEKIYSTSIQNFRKTELISQLYHLTQAKLQSTAVYKDQIETIQAQLITHFHSFTLASIYSKLTLMKSNILEKVEKLKLEFNTKADMMFIVLKDTSIDEIYGLVLAGAPPFKCHFKRETIIGEKATAYLQTLDISKQPCTIPMSSIASFVMQERTSNIINCSLKKISQSIYEISYQPTVKGMHQLHITVQDQHIKGSPFHFTVRSPTCTVLGRVKKPDGLTVNQEGEIILTSWDEHCVTVFNPRGERLLSFGTQGSHLGQFLCPSGIAVDSKGNILVADSANHRIQKFTAKGRFLVAVGQHGSGHLQFDTPRGIVVNTSNGKLYVTDEQNDRIQILNFDLSWHGIFGEAGCDKGQLSKPRHIACDSKGDVYVADWGNHRIQVFTAEGKFVRMFGEYGIGPGELKSPYGIALDSTNRVYVSEQGNHRVSVFTYEGQFSFSVGNKRRTLGQVVLEDLRGLAIINSGILYVCDHS